MHIKEIIKSMTFEEKALFLSGDKEAMGAFCLKRLSIPLKKFADASHGVRTEETDECVSLPNLCCVGASWSLDTMYEMGGAIATECIKNDIDLILGPGVNIKKNILCGRNFEYISEDPVVAGELAAAYVRGTEDKGIGTSVKHFAANNQEMYRSESSSEIDIRTLREIYLKPFEIIVEKSKPSSIMCSYNKLNSIWTSENKYLLTRVLKNEWGYEGFVLSDWGSVHDALRSVKAGLDLQMPHSRDIAKVLREAVDEGEITEAQIDESVMRLMKFALKEKPKKTEYKRAAQHEIARKIAAEGIVLMKNENSVLPLTPQKYKKIAVVGEFAVNPVISGQGSAEVNVNKKYIDSPIEELKAALGEKVKIKYKEYYKKSSFSETMLWPNLQEFSEFVGDSDVVILFIGSMTSEDTEYFDRRCAEFNKNYEMFIKCATESGKKVVVVMQMGSAMILGDCYDKVDGIVQMWLGGEAAGGAIADVLTGKVNPSGKLTETFPKMWRRDLDYPGDGLKVLYNEKLDVGYRYYDKHPEEIRYPFGHGLSYTNFEYSEMSAKQKDNKLFVSIKLKNTGAFDGSEVVQLYVGDVVSTVTKPIKELKAFKKLFLKSGEEKEVSFELSLKDLAYYNVMLEDWITEEGEYTIYIGSSSRDIRCEKSIYINCEMPYSIEKVGEEMIGNR